MMIALRAALLLLASATVANAQSIGGDYAVKGANLDGSGYSGTARINLTSDTTCEIIWITGGTTSSGICSRNGDAFAAAYELGDAIGLVIYKMLPDGSLNGLWTIAGESGVGTEILTPR